MKRKLIAPALVFSGFLIAFAFFADLNGKWSGLLNAPTGDQYPLSYDFKVNGNKLTGTLDVAGMSVPIDSGKVSGENFSFSVSVQGRAYPTTGKYYANGDSVGMDVDFGGPKSHAKFTRDK
jgi:hypothetical protein